MTLQTPGIDTLETEVVHINSHGFWLNVKHRNLSLLFIFSYPIKYKLDFGYNLV